MGVLPVVVVISRTAPVACWTAVRKADALDGRGCVAVEKLVVMAIQLLFINVHILT